MLDAGALGVEDWQQVVDRKVTVNAVSGMLQAQLDDRHFGLWDKEVNGKSPFS